MKKSVVVLAVLCLGLFCLQQKSYADKKVQHAEYKETALSDCNDCHKSEGVAPNHGADFLRSHRVLASKAGHNCGQCHEQKWCLDCHQGGGTGDDLAQSNFGRDYMPKSHRSDFITIHPIKAKDNPQNCYRCHDAVAFCNSCHSRFPAGALHIKSHMMTGATGQQYVFVSGEHASEARRNLQSCQTCHPEGDVCIQCHSTGKTNPHPRSWSGSYIKNRTNAQMCLKCHLPGTF